MVTPRRFEVWLCNFDPAVGREIRKVRPAVVVSPDEVNRHVSWFTMAPMTTGSFVYATRVVTRFEGREAAVVVDQLRCMDRVRLIRCLGELDPTARAALLSALGAFFAP